MKYFTLKLIVKTRADTTEEDIESHLIRVINDALKRKDEGVHFIGTESWSVDRLEHNGEVVLIEDALPQVPSDDEIILADDDIPWFLKKQAH